MRGELTTMTAMPPEPTTGQPDSPPARQRLVSRLPVWQIVISLIKPVLWTGAALNAPPGGRALGPPIPQLTNYPGIRCGGGARRAGARPRLGEVKSGAAAN